ncbi:MAG TPA: ABC transporter permease [Bryobacteraceae bacterium]|nr:ABC transporter permease [Bryobacteraceae bacterium]
MPCLNQVIRSLLRAPTFTLFAVAAIALGIGANTAIYSVFHAVLVRPLPFADPDRLVMVWEDLSHIGFAHNTPAPANYWDWKKQNTVFSGMAASQGCGGVMAGQPPEEFMARCVTPDFFQVLGVKPALGRDFRDEDTQVNPPRAIILTDMLWRRRFNADPGIIGREVTVAGARMEVVGVMPPSMRFPDRQIEAYMPAAIHSPRWQGRGNHFLMVFARLKEGVTVERAQSEMSAISRRLEQAYPNSNTKLGAVIVPFRTEAAGDTAPLLRTLFAAAAVLLLIACANVANLMLTRASGRQREFAIRLALGAGGGALIKQVTAEAVVLAAAGGALGLGLALASLRFLGDLVPAGMRGVMVPVLNGNAVLFALGVSLTTAALIALLPTIRILRGNVAGALQHGDRTGASRASVRTRGALVVIEVALSVLLVAVGALLVQRMIALRSESLGFRSEQLLTLRTRLPGPRYDEPLKRVQYYDAVVQRVRALPGVMEAGFTSTLPFLSYGNTSTFRVEGVVFGPGEENDALTRVVTPGYLRAMQPQLLAGRLLAEADDGNAAPAVVINETFSKRFYKSPQDAVGRKIQADGNGPQAPWRTIVGVVRDMKERGYDYASKVGVYLPVKQDSGWWAQHLVVRVRGDADSLIRPVSAVIHEVDPELAVAQVRTMDAIVDEVVSERKQHQSLSVVFAGIAVALAALGIFAVLSFNVLLRTREIGVRMAVGAQPAAIAGMVIRNGVAMTGLGIVLGCLASEAAARVLRSLLDRVPESSPWLFAGVAAFFLAVSAAASWWPALRATRIEPMRVLREE